MSNSPLFDIAFYDSIRSDSIAVHLWTHLNLYAATSDSQVKVGNKMVDVPAGSLLTSRIDLSKLTGINEHKIDRLLKMLVMCSKVEQQATTKYRLISIVNKTPHGNGEQQVSSKCAASEQQPKKKRVVFKPPTLEEINEYIEKMGYTINGALFFNHYKANGWKVGKVKMVSWKAGLTGWQTRKNDEKVRTISKDTRRDELSEYIESEGRAAATRLSQGSDG